MSRLEHASFAAGENAVLICLSVVAAVQCCMVISGSTEPVFTIFISHRPGLQAASHRRAHGTAAASSAERTPGKTKQAGVSCFRAPVGRLIDALVRPDAGSV